MSLIKMSLILSLETSTTVTSAALHDKGKLISFEITHVPNSAASQLAVMIDKLLKQYSGKLDAVAVSSGPGSYTGLRIGVATAKGLCYALSVPLIALNTLELVAHQLLHSEFYTLNSMLCPMIDARRMEVYTMLFDGELNVVSPTEAKIIDQFSFADQLQKNKIFFFGNGADKCRSTITHPDAVFVDNIFPSAEWMGELAYASFESNRFENLADFEPAYLKDFIAKKPKSLV
jgi:tRNA threonylcarbamoyladenosine biosynthesis protein TsaB